MDNKLPLRQDYKVAYFTLRDVMADMNKLRALKSAHDKANPTSQEGQLWWPWKYHIEWNVHIGDLRDTRTSCFSKKFSRMVKRYGTHAPTEEDIATAKTAFSEWIKEMFPGELAPWAKHLTKKGKHEIHKPTIGSLRPRDGWSFNLVILTPGVKQPAVGSEPTASAQGDGEGCQSTDDADVMDPDDPKLVAEYFKKIRPCRREELLAVLNWLEVLLGTKDQVVMTDFGGNGTISRATIAHLLELLNHELSDFKDFMENQMGYHASGTQSGSQDTYDGPVPPLVAILLDAKKQM